jgi:hypothetical protein
MNLVSRSFGRCLCNRLLSGCTIRFSDRLFWCNVTIKFLRCGAFSAVRVISDTQHVAEGTWACCFSNYNDYVTHFSSTEQMLSWYPNSTLLCMLHIQPSQWYFQNFRLTQPVNPTPTQKKKLNFNSTG